MTYAQIDPDLQKRIATLTKREREVLALVGEGYSLPSIAEKLYRSLKTIESHRLSLGRKLRVSNRVELARIAIQMGLSPLPGHEQLARQQSRDIRERVRDRHKAWEVLRAIDALVSTADKPREVLSAIAEAIQTQLSAEAVVTISCGERGDCETVASATRDRGSIAKTFSDDDALIFDITQESYIALDPVPEPYRDHPLVGERDVKAIYGIRLEDHTRQPNGALVVLVDWPVPEDLEIELLLRAMASRAAAELDELHHLRTVRELADLCMPEDHNADQGPRMDRPLFRERANAIHDGLASIDAEFRLVYVNPVLATWIGVPAEELIGQDVSVIQTHEHANWFREVQPLREGGKLRRYRLDLVDSRERPFPTVAYPASVFDAAGNYAGSFGLLVRL
ncbi:MAG: LuxR C-terminal-related transcriptional regulator [Phycisphaeraceae bacterium]